MNVIETGKGEKESRRRVKRGDENLLLSIFPIKLVLRKIFPRVRLQGNRAVKLSSICHCELCEMRCEKVFCVATKSLLSIRFFTAPETFTPRNVFPHQQILIVSSLLRIITTRQPHPSICISCHQLRTEIRFEGRAFTRKAVEVV